MPSAAQPAVFFVPITHRLGPVEQRFGEARGLVTIWAPAFLRAHGIRGHGDPTAGGEDLLIRCLPCTLWTGLCPPGNGLAEAAEGEAGLAKGYAHVVLAVAVGSCRVRVIGCLKQEPVSMGWWPQKRRGTIPMIVNSSQNKLTPRQLFM